MMLNISLKSDNKMLYIPNEETISSYLDAIVTYYETGKYSKFKAYFIEEYKKTIESILSIENAKIEEQTILPRSP